MGLHLYWLGFKLVQLLKFGVFDFFENIIIFKYNFDEFMGFSIDSPPLFAFLTLFT